MFLSRCLSVCNPSWRTVVNRMKMKNQGGKREETECGSLLCLLNRIWVVEENTNRETGDGTALWRLSSALPAFSFFRLLRFVRPAAEISGERTADASRCGQMTDGRGHLERFPDKSPNEMLASSTDVSTRHTKGHGQRDTCNATYRGLFFLMQAVLKKTLLPLINWYTCRSYRHTL